MTRWRVVEANGTRLAVCEDGPEHGRAIVFSNSLGTNLSIWDELLPLSPAGLRIVCYDQRGHGRSEVPPAPYAMTDHVADLVGLLDALEIENPIIVGLSIGGMIAQALGAIRPNRASILILMDTAHRIGTAETWNARIEAVESGGLAAIADGVMERWFSQAFRATRPEQVARWRKLLLATPVLGYLGSCAAVRDADCEADARAIAVPTLVLCGSQDMATPPALAKAMADIIPAAKFVMIGGAGHLPCIEAPQIVAQHISGFLKEHDLVR